MQQIVFLLVLIGVAFGPSVDAQRPTYAGSRPGGLSQKDKYHASNNVNSINNNSLNSITSRFGEDDAAAPPTTNKIAFGAAQRPPVGLPVVMPQAAYVPIAPIAGAGANGIVLNSRFGGVADTPQASTATPQRLPLDAHGDRDLITQLNLIPEDRRPFWFLNFQAIEAQRNGTSSGSTGASSGVRGSFQG